MAVPLETKIFVFNRTDPYFDSLGPNLPPAGRLGAGHVAELLGRSRGSIAPVEGGSVIDDLTGPAVDYARAWRAERAVRAYRKRLEKRDIFGDAD